MRFNTLHLECIAAEANVETNTNPPPKLCVRANGHYAYLCKILDMCFAVVCEVVQR